MVPLLLSFVLLGFLKEQAPAVKTAPVPKGTLTAAEEQNVLCPWTLEREEDSRGCQALAGCRQCQRDVAARRQSTVAQRLALCQAR